MNTLTKHFLLAALVLTTTAASAAEVPWWTFTGGGGISQHGAKAIGGAIGPIAPALSPATGGNSTLTGGFWPSLSGQPKAASAVLTIKYLGGNKTVISWPVGVTGFILEYTTDLGSGIWLPEPEAVTDTAVEHTVTVHTMPAFRGFRLRGE